MYWFCMDLQLCYIIVAAAAAGVVITVVFVAVGKNVQQ